MARKKRSGGASKLDRAAAAFAAWRKTRQGRSRIPPELWRAAVEAAGESGIAAVTKALRIGSSGIKKRMGPDGAGEPFSSRRDPGFVEFGAAEFPPLRSEWVVELEDGRGGRMRLSVKGAGPDAASLCRAFRGAGT